MPKIKKEFELNELFDRLDKPAVKIQTPTIEILLKDSKEAIKQYLHLCRSCKHNLATCKGKPEFGTGIGSDNVYKCNKFKNKFKEH